MDDRNIPEHWPDERKDVLRNAPRASVVTVARVRSYATYHEVWDSCRGRYVRCECSSADSTHYEDPPPPVFISGAWPQGQVIARATFRAPIEHAQFAGMVTRPKCGLCGDYIYDEVESERGVPLADPARIAHVRCAIAVKSEKSA